MPDTTPTPQPFRFIDEDDFCLSARLVFNLPATLSITIEGSDEPQSAHVPVGDLPKVLAGIAEAAGLASARQVCSPTDQQPATAPADTELRDRRDRYAALFRSAPGEARLGDATPGEIAEAVMAVADTEQAELGAELERRTLMLHASRGVVEGLDEALRGAIAASEKDGARLRAEVERLRTDRAAVLREAAEVAVRAARGCGDSETGQYAASVAAGIGRDLRRMADEAQQPTATKAAPLATPCNICGHTLNWHRNEGGCSVHACYCRSWQQPETEAAADTLLVAADCPYGVGPGDGSGCIKPSGHDGDHAITPGVPVVSCSRTVLRQSHIPHVWWPQPGMTPVHCPGAADESHHPGADQPDTEPEAAPLAVGDRYECRTRARTVTVTRLWVDEYGADAVAFEWRGGMSGAAHSVDMFHQLYRPAP